MSKIHRLSIKNFRGIKSFSHSFTSNFICIVGRGDSGKSTILEAISYVLSPNWNITFYDNDFYNCNSEETIEIEATIKDLPEALFKEDKFGFYIRGLTTSGDIIDDIDEDSDPVLTINLKVAKDLEPQWTVVNGRQPEPIKISATDRAKINAFIVSDQLDKHFSWNKGTPLYSLYLQHEKPKNEDENVIIEALRKAKKQIDGSFSKFSNVIETVKTSAAKFGINISETDTTIDFKDLFIKDGKVCLHENSVPFRLKGKGSKRLISISIQSAIAAEGGIVLIDELEQGLEPDRAQHLAKVLKENNSGQIFLTTHSRDVLVELSTIELYLMKTGGKSLLSFPNTLQGCVRANPEAFFANKIIVCEGETEIGICRAMDSFRGLHGKMNLAYNGIRFTKGGGSQFASYCQSFNQLGYPTAVLCDSDSSRSNNINGKKQGLRSKGIKIFDWEEGDYLEAAVVKDLPSEGIKQVLILAAELNAETKGISVAEAKKRILQSIKQKSGKEFPTELNDRTCTKELRSAIGAIACEKSWFKSISKGEKLGNIVYNFYDDLKGKRLREQLDLLSQWADTNGS